MLLNFSHLICEDFFNMRKTVKLICQECDVVFESKNHKQLCCSHKCSNKYQAYLRKNTIDPSTGLTLAQLYSKRATLKNHQTWYQSNKFKELLKTNRKTARSNPRTLDKIKSALSKRAEKDINGISPAQLSTQKALETKRKNGKVIALERMNDWQLYHYLVKRYTSRQDISTLPNYEKRGRAGKNSNSFHLDHRYSIFDGFNNKVPPEIIGNIKNLEFIPWHTNVKKNHKSSITLNCLYELIGVPIKLYHPDNYEEIKKSKNSAQIMNSIRKECPYCQKTMSIGNLHRWHNDKCKNNPEVK